MAMRLQAMGQPNYRNGFTVTTHEHVLGKPLGWRSPQVIFVNSMSDLFHEDVLTDFIVRAFDVMRQAEWHVFQILTKRAERLAELAPALPWPANVWMGVTVESNDYVDRADSLRTVPAKVRFISAEPLLGALPDLQLGGIDWLIVGGESGPGARPMEPNWPRELLAMARASDTAFFFKQWGGVNKKKAGRQLDGRTWDEMPHAISAVL
jgi:protein gp37